MQGFHGTRLFPVLHVTPCSRVGMFYSSCGPCRLTALILATWKTQALEAIFFPKNVVLY